MKDYWIRIFKAGKHTDSGGNTREWTQDELKAVADAYNAQPAESRHDAPLRPGDHSTSYVDEKGKVVFKPALGYVSALKYEDGSLMANVLPTPELVEGVRNNRYKKVSSGFKTKDGRTMLDHVAILGAVNPAVKGLGMLEMSEEQFTEYEHSEDLKTAIEKIADAAGDDIYIKPREEHLISRFAESITNVFEKFGGEMKKLFSKTEEQAKQPPRKDDNNNSNINNHNVGEDMDPKILAAVIDELKSEIGDENAVKVSAVLKKHMPAGVKKKDDGESNNQDADSKDAPKFEETKEYKAMQEKIADLEKRNRQKEFSEFLEKNKEKITPAMKPFALAIMENIDGKGELEFTEDGKAQKVTGKDLFTKLVEKMPEQVKLGDTEIYGMMNHKENEFADDDKYIEERNKEKGVV